MSTMDVFGGHRVIPVVVLDDPVLAVELGAAMVDGGLPVAEVTFRTPDAVSVLRSMASRPGLLAGAGTVITAEQVDRAHDAGASFVVSPGLSETVVRRCQQLGLPVLPGVSTASEIIRALDLGLDTVKLFPAEACGGLATVQALSAAFPQVGFVPTGGITESSAPGYLAHRAVAAVGGSWMVAADLLAAERWDEVKTRCVAAARLSDPQLQGALT